MKLKMSISKYPSTITLPQVVSHPTILAFLIERFPHIPATIWEERIKTGKVLDGEGCTITTETPCTPQAKILYFREVPEETPIPFAEKTLFRNDELLVADKPHFLPVTPGGGYVNECLLNRLRAATGNDDLIPIHRLDRETAGIVLFSANPKTRGLYQRMFAEGVVEKIYHAISEYRQPSTTREWVVENRIVQEKTGTRRTVVPGEVNSRSHIQLQEIKDGRALFRLEPITGKTHQLRIHMCCIGYCILNDRFYPELQPQGPNDYDKPLQLLAKQISFQDPITGEMISFQSERELLL